LTNEKQVVQQRPQILDQLPQVRVRHQAANQEQPELNKNAESPPARAQAQASRSGERLSSLAPLFAGTSVEKVTLKTAEKPQNATRTRSGSARPNAEIATSKSPKRPPQVEPQATKPQTTEARTSSSDREAVVSKPSSASQESGVPGTMTSRTPSPVKSATSAPPMQRMAEAVLDQVTRGLRVSLDQARSEVTLQLKPESLGTIRMRLSVENGAVQAMIQVENAEIRKIIESGLTRLGERLAEQGYRLDRSHVTVETLPVERQTATWSPRDEQPSFGRQHQQEQQQSQGRNAPWQEPRRRHPEQRFELYG
jgi:flagellar hook-length control protein FliK